MKKLLLWSRHFLCGLFGHNLQFRFEPGKRFYTECVDCHYETPGWAVK